MTKQKQVTEQELDQVAGGPVYVKLGDMTDRHNNLQESCANGTFFRGFNFGPVGRLANVDMQNLLNTTTGNYD